MTIAQADIPETAAKSMDEKIKNATGMDLFNWLTAATVVTSIALYVAGKKHAAIFLGLWPPTFQALKSGTKAEDADEY